MLRRMFVIAGLIGSLVWAQVSFGQEAKSAAEATRSGFKVIVIITTDPDWRAKWNTSPETVPHFRGPGLMKPGDKGTVLALFSNPRLRNGEAVLECDLTALNPDGTGTKHPAQLCFKGKPTGVPGSIYLAGMEVAFEVGPNEPSGLHGFEIGITDVHRGVRVPVRVTVEFATGKGST